MKIRVLLADDHTIVRQGLRLVLDTAPDIEVVGEVENGKEAVEMARKLKPDIILLDLVMPVLDGLNAARQINKLLPKCKVLMLSSYSDEECVRQLLACGVVGYLVKQSAGTELLQAIRDTQRGQAYFSLSISRNLFEQGRNWTSGSKMVPKKKQQLTPREQQVLLLIAQGLPNKAIAPELGISIKTVEKHRQQVMNKLDIHYVAGLTKHAISTGIINTDGARSVLN